MDLDKLPVVDWELAMKLAGNNQDIAKEILALFIKNIPGELTAINQSFQNKNYQEMGKQLHKLHGALCYCGLPRIKMLVAQLESSLKNNVTDDLSAHVELLNQEVNDLLANYAKSA